MIDEGTFGVIPSGLGVREMSDDGAYQFPDQRDVEIIMLVGEYEGVEARSLASNSAPPPLIMLR